jgi:anti-repressor protein
MSSTDVKIFEKEEFGSVRVVMQGDDPWFVASDVAKSLGYDNPANAINTHFDILPRLKSGDSYR